MEGQWSHVAAWSRYILVDGGKPYKFVLELLNVADDIVRDGNSRKRDVFENWTDTLFVNLDYGGWARPPFFVD